MGLWSRPLAALRRRRAAELAGPDDQRLVEQAAGLEILQQRGDRLVDLARLAQRAGVRVVVVVPVLAVAAAGDDLHETHAALDQPAGDQAARAEVARDVVVEAVELSRRVASRCVMSTASGAAVCMRNASS